MADRLTDEEQALWHAWKQAAEAVRARVGADITADTGLSDVDFAVLTRLVDLGRGTVRQNELAASTGWHRSRLSHQLTRMEQRGLVRRRSVEGGVEVHITEAGSTAAAAARPVHAAAVRRHLLDRVPAAQAEALRALLTDLAT
jgi:DNA-binding MarR family transcriptional regulator